MLRNAWQNIYQSALNMLDKLKNDRYMAGAEWKEVAKNILPVAIDEDIKIEHSNIIYEIRKRLLEKERNIYWSLFSEGLLSSNAVMELSNTIDIMLDNEGKISLSQRKDLEELWSVNKFWQRIFKITFLKKLLSQYLSNKLSFGFDCARGFALAQDELLKVLRSVALNIQTDSTDEKINEIIDNLENEIFENRIQALTFMRNTKELYPDIYKSIETKYASRYLLNFQMLRLSKLIDQRQIEEDEAVIILTKLMNKLKEI